MKIKVMPHRDPLFMNEEVDKIPQVVNTNLQKPDDEDEEDDSSNSSDDSVVNELLINSDEDEEDDDDNENDYEHERVFAVQFSIQE